MYKKIRPMIVVALVPLLLLSGCNLPRAAAPTQPEPGLIYTVAAQTVEAELTRVAAGEGAQPTQPQTTQAPGEGQQPTPAATNTPAMPLPTNTVPPITQAPPQTATNTPAPTPTGPPCNRLSFVKDVTVPDDAEMSPGEKFTKTWRLKNTGSCTWTSGYDLVFDHGDSMGAPPSVQITTGTIAPGQEVDVSVELTAPDDPGTYQGYFKLRSTEGIVFGWGDESKPFWVKIVVKEETGLMFDFIARASDADWGSGVGNVHFSGPGDVSITFGGPDTDHDGYAMIKDGVKLENGSTSGKVLVMHPKWENDGYIVGKFPEYTVGAGDHISGRIGFLAENDGTCGNGNAVFAIDYTIGDDLNTRERLASWTEKCDGSLRLIDIDLDDLKGEKVHFYLVIKANGSYQGDKAVWRSLGVFR